METLLAIQCSLIEMQSDVSSIALAIVSIDIKSVTVHTLGNLLVCLTNILHVTTLTFNQINDILRRAICCYATNVALHFNSDSHSLNDFRFLPIDVVKNEMDRLCKETYWIHKLDTLHPKGMNSKLLYTMK